MLPSLQPRLQLPWRSQPPTLQESREDKPLSKPEEMLMQIRNEYNFSDFSISSFREWASKKRGRSIQMVPKKFAPGVFGVWVKFGQEDLIFYDEQAEGLYLTHIQVHELAHVLCDHVTLDLAETDLGYTSMLTWIYGRDKILPTTLDSNLSKILLRTHHNRQKSEEVEAEALTELIMGEIFGEQQNMQMVVAPSYTQNPIIHEVFQDLGWQ